MGLLPTMGPLPKNLSFDGRISTICPGWIYDPWMPKRGQSFNTSDS